MIGGVGRFWQPTGGLRPIEAAEFGDFDEPGFAKAVFNFRLERSGDRTLVRTETRIAPPTSTPGAGSGSTGGSSIRAAH